MSWLSSVVAWLEWISESTRSSVLKIRVFKPTQICCVGEITPTRRRPTLACSPIMCVCD